jgi:tRNA threonylcarbamoyladenosine biosynthesis protein TsaE
MVTPIETTASDSAEATESTGRDLSTRLQPADVVLLEGELAAGKTTFVRGLVAGLGGNPDLVSSPTFVLQQSYDCGGGEITVLHHVDLYRLAENVADLREIGLEDTLSDPTAVIAVEWPKDTLATWIPADTRTWRIAITTEDDDSRRIEITPPDETCS